MSLGDNVDAEGAPMVAQSIYTIVQTIVRRTSSQQKGNMNDFICPKCNQPGLPSIYLPMCTACANIERRKSGEIKDDNAAQQSMHLTGGMLPVRRLLSSLKNILSRLLALATRK